MTLPIEAAEYLQYVPGIIWVVDRDMKYIAVEGEKLGEWNLDKADVIGKTVAELHQEKPDGLNMTSHKRAFMNLPVSYQLAIGEEFYECKLRYLPGKDLIVGVATDVSRAIALKEKLEFQNQKILEYSTPIVPVLDHAVIMPIVGHLNAEKAQFIQQQAVQEIYKMRDVKYVIMDLSGIQNFDHASCEAFEQIQSVLHLLGYETIITGIQRSIALEIVRCGSKLNADIVYATLKEAVKSLLI